MATLKTIGWTRRDGQIMCQTIVFDLDRILLVQEDNGSRGDTCIVFLTPSMGVHVDIPLKQMIKIMNEHEKFPDKDFDTHPEPDLSWLAHSSNRQTSFPSQPVSPPPRPIPHPSQPLAKYRKPKQD